MLRSRKNAATQLAMGRVGLSRAAEICDNYMSTGACSLLVCCTTYDLTDFGVNVESYLYVLTYV